MLSGTVDLSWVENYAHKRGFLIFLLLVSRTPSIEKFKVYILTKVHNCANLIFYNKKAL